MKFYVLPKCSEKKHRRERERVCVIIQSQHEKNEIFFLGQLKSETIEMHHFSCFFLLTVVQLQFRYSAVFYLLGGPDERRPLEISIGPPENIQLIS